MRVSFLFRYPQDAGGLFGSPSKPPQTTNQKGDPQKDIICESKLGKPVRKPIDSLRLDKHLKPVDELEPEQRGTCEC